MNYITHIAPKDYFSVDELQLFTKIPHKKEQTGKITTYDFDVPENGKYPLLYRNKIVELNGNLTEEEVESNLDLLYSIGAYNGEKGLYVEGNHGDQIINFMIELYKHDKENSLKMLDKYHKFCLESKEAFALSNCLFEQTNALISYLDKENIKVKDLNLDIKKLISLNDDEAEVEVERLRSKNHYKFPAYNDLDYCPFLFGDIYLIEDYSGDRTYICKKEGDKITWYESTNHYDYEISDWVTEFLYEEKQKARLILDDLNESKIVVEFVDGKMTKATSKMDTLNLLQGHIFKELLKNGKIEYEFPDMTFEELLCNHALQKEFYGIEERSLVRLLPELKMINHKLTYDDFSLMDMDSGKKQIKHEQILEHSLKSLKSTGYDKVDLSNLMSLPEKYKEQISNYLDDLVKRGGDFDSEFADIVRSHLCYIPGVSNTKEKKTTKIKM